MVAFTDLPKVACVRTTAVTTVHSGSGTLSKCEKAKPDSAAIVTLRERPSCALCSGNCDRSDLNSVATLLIRNSVRTVSNADRPRAQRFLSISRDCAKHLQR